VKACRTLSENFAKAGDSVRAEYYRNAAVRLWYKISAISHVTPEQMEIYGGQPNKQCADYLTKYDPGRMIWNGYTGAAGWMMRQAVEGVMGYSLEGGVVLAPEDISEPRGGLKVSGIERDVSRSSLNKVL
jgi:cyclic beta-1,2-glucan synthetase